MQSCNPQTTKQSNTSSLRSMMHRGGASSMAFFPNGKSKISSISIIETKKMGLLRKVEELSALCGVKSCAIIYTSDTDSIPQTWPADHLQVQMFLTKFKSLPEYEQTKFSTNVDTLLQQRIEKAKLKLARLMRESKVKQAREDISHLLDGRKLGISSDGYRDISLAINRALKEVKRRMEELRSKRDDIEKNPYECNNLEAVGLLAQQRYASQDLMKLVADEMGSHGLVPPDQQMDTDLIYYDDKINECDLITNFNVDDLNFDFEQDQWF